MVALTRPPITRQLPIRAGEASYGCVCHPIVGKTISFLTANTTGWVNTGRAGLPLAASCGGVGAGEGEKVTLHAAALVIIVTLETRGVAGETGGGLVGCGRAS